MRKATFLVVLVGFLFTATFALSHWPPYTNDQGTALNPPYDTAPNFRDWFAKYQACLSHGTPPAACAKLGDDQLTSLGGNVGDRHGHIPNPRTPATDDVAPPFATQIDQFRALSGQVAVDGLGGDDVVSVTDRSVAGSSGAVVNVPNGTDVATNQSQQEANNAVAQANQDAHRAVESSNTQINNTSLDRFNHRACSGIGSSCSSLDDCCPGASACVLGACAT